MDFITEIEKLPGHTAAAVRRVIGRVVATGQHWSEPFGADGDIYAYPNMIGSTDYIAWGVNHPLCIARGVYQPPAPAEIIGTVDFTAQDREDIRLALSEYIIGQQKLADACGDARNMADHKQTFSDRADRFRALLNRVMTVLKG